MLKVTRAPNAAQLLKLCLFSAVFSAVFATASAASANEFLGGNQYPPGNGQTLVSYMLGETYVPSGIAAGANTAYFVGISNGSNKELMQAVLSYGTGWHCGNTVSGWALVTDNYDATTGTEQCGNVVAVNPGDRIFLSTTITARQLQCPWGFCDFFLLVSTRAYDVTTGQSSNYSIEWRDDGSGSFGSVTQEWLESNTSCDQMPSLTLDTVYAQSADGNYTRQSSLSSSLQTFQIGSTPSCGYSAVSTVHRNSPNLATLAIGY